MIGALYVPLTVFGLKMKMMLKEIEKMIGALYLDKSKKKKSG